MKRIAMLLTNPCIHDSRVIKEAETLAAVGYEITVFCFWKKDLPSEETISGVRYLRIPVARNPMVAIRRALTFPYRVTKKIIRLVIRACFPAAQQCSEDKEAAHESQLTCVSPPAPPAPSTPTRTRQESARWLGLKQTTRGFIVEMLKYRLCRSTFLSAVLAYKPDVVHAHDLVTLPTGVDAARALSAKLIFDSHELEEHRDPPAPAWIKRRTKRLLDRYIPQADAMIVVSEGIAEYTREHHSRLPPLEIIFNAPRCTKGKAPERSLREQLAIPADHKIAIFVGGVGLNRGVDNIVRAVALTPRMHLAIVGPRHPFFDGILMETIEATSTKSRVHLLPAVPHDDVISFVSGADVGVVVLKNVCLSHYYSMPNKLFEMLFAGLPIVTGESHDIAKFVRKHEVGLVTNQHDPKAIAEALIQACEQRSRFLVEPRRMRDLQEEFSWEAQSTKLLAIYKRLCA